MTTPLGPLQFLPRLKRIIWGGRRLGEKLGKPIGDGDDYAESWEVVDRDADQSVVAGGPCAGLSLRDLVQRHRNDLLGRHAQYDTFPLLIKYLDCQRVLSVQVHPDDAYGSQMSTPDLGKTEAWYIVEAQPQSVIYAGLKAGVSRADLQAAVAAGRTEETLHSFHPQAGQCVFIPAGTVHALGEGLVVAEVQQSSDTTFRLFDWNRVDAAGKPRDLHIEQALAVTDFSRGPVQPVMSPLDAGGWSQLVTCDKFRLRRANADDDPSRELHTGGEEELVILMLTSGEAEIQWQHGEPMHLSGGQTVLLPACLGTSHVKLSAAANLLEVRLP